MNDDKWTYEIADMMPPSTNNMKVAKMEKLIKNPTNMEQFEEFMRKLDETYKDS